MTIRLNQNSRLRFADLVDVDGITFFDYLYPPRIEPQSDDIIRIVQAGDRIDSIAYEMYRDTALWWVIALANDLEILPTQLNVGMELRIPAPRYVRGQVIPSAAGRR